MLAHRYKVWSWGNQRTDGQEDCIKYDVGVTTVAKRNRYQAYEVFNEIVCAELGRVLGLPIPVGMVTDKDGVAYYCSGNVSPGNEFPPADLAHLAINHPRLYCGIAAFDGWVCNPDRHGKNIFYDADEGSIYLIDHGSALLSTRGSIHLSQNTGHLPLRQEFAEEARHFNSFCDWFDKIVRIPRHFIDATVREAAKVGVDINEAVETGNLLIARRSGLCRLFSSHRSSFPKLVNSLFTPFTCDDDPSEFCI